MFSSKIKILSGFVVIVGGLSLSSCGVNPVTAHKLKRTDIEKSDPGELRVALQIKEGVTLGKVLSVVKYDVGEGVQRKELMLQRLSPTSQQGAAEFTALSRFRKKGQRFVIAKYSPKDTAWLRLLQKTLPPKVKAQQKRKKKGFFELGFGATFCGQEGLKKIPYRLFVKTTEIPVYSILVFERDLVHDLKRWQKKSGSSRRTDEGCPK